MRSNWTENQKKIYEGLQSIGGEAAACYESALRHYYDESLPNRVSLLAHSARELDGGLRDIFTDEVNKKKKEKDLISKGIEALFGAGASNNKGHIASILTALNVDEKDALANEWISVATKFHKYAHRHGVWKEPREFNEFKPIWDKYEDVLLKLIGSFYSITARLDQLMRLVTINEAASGALLNLLTVEPYERYFFGKVNNLGWYLYLSKAGFFNPENFHRNKEGVILLPYAFDYLEKISLQVPSNPEYGKKLIDIIENVVKYSRDPKQKKINDYCIWWYCVKILNNLPINVIKDNLVIDDQSDKGKTRYGFCTWLKTWMNFPHGNDVAIPDLGEKLLAKFLDADNMIDYAQAIIETITAICPDTKKKLAFSDNQAVMVWEAYWVLDAFKKEKDKIAAKCSDKTVYYIADQFKKALEYKQKDTWTDIQICGNLYHLKSSRVSRDDLKENEIGYKDSEYSVLLRQYSPEQIKGTDIKNDFWSLQKIEPDVVLAEFSFKARDKAEFVSNVKANLPSGINWELAEEFEKTLGHLFSNLYSDYSYIWFKSLKSNSIINPRDAEEVLAIILRDLLLSRCKLDANKAKPMLEIFLGDRYKFPIFRRMVLLCLDKYWDNYFELLEKFLESVPSVLAKSDYELELHDVLLNHRQHLTSSVKKKLRKLIDDLPGYYLEKGPKFIAYWRYKWLSPLRQDAEFKDEYEKAKKLAEIKEDKPYEPDRSAMVAKAIGNISSLSLEELLELPVIDLVKYLLDFKGADDWGRMEGKPDKEGLANTLQAAVKEQPEKYLDNLELFNRPDLYLYVNAIIRGFCDALKTGKSLPWGGVLTFVSGYINQSWFIDEAFQAQGVDRGKARGEYVWVFESIADLIKEGSRDNEKAINQDQFGLTEAVFADMFKLIQGETEPNADRDAFTYAINTTLGKAIEAFIVFSLRVARVKQKNNEDQEKDWGKNKYETLFSKGPEAYTWFGHYLPNIRYLNKTFADNKIHELAALEAKDKNWQRFMEGYLYGAYVYDDIYGLMRDHYVKALETKFFDEQTERRLVQHITIEYLRGEESLEVKNKHDQDSLFFNLLADSDTSEKRNRWLEVANFFWSMAGKNTQKDAPDDKEKISDKMKEKILSFWAWTVTDKEIIKTRLGEDYASFLGRMADLTILLPKIDETNEDWLMLSAAHIEARHHMTFFIDYLARYEDDESVRRIGKIFLKVLDGTTPTFRQEDIQLIVERLYKLAKKNQDDKVKTDADNICNAYGRRGVDFLKKLYEKNR